MVYLPPFPEDIPPHAGIAGARDAVRGFLATFERLRQRLEAVNADKRLTAAAKEADIRAAINEFGPRPFVGVDTVLETLEGRRAHFRDRWRQQLLSDVPEREAAAEPEYRRYFGSLTVAGRREALEAAIRDADRFALRSVLVSPAPRALSGLSEVELEHFGDQARKALDPEGDRMADDYRRAHGAVLMAGAMYAELLRSHHRYSGPGIPAWAWSTVAEVASATPIRLERVHAPDLPPAAA